MYYEHVQDGRRWRIERSADGWVPCCDGQSLAPGYRSAAHALAGLLSGYTDWPDGRDPSTLALPKDLSAWAWRGP